jgi:hypothetical protein
MENTTTCLANIAAKCLARVVDKYRIRPLHFNFEPAYGKFDKSLAQVCTVAKISQADFDKDPTLEANGKTHWLLDGNHRLSLAPPDELLACVVVDIALEQNQLAVLLLSVRTNVSAHTVSKVRLFII